MFRWLWPAKKPVDRDDEITRLKNEIDFLEEYIEGREAEILRIDTTNFELNNKLWKYERVDREIATHDKDAVAGMNVESALRSASYAELFLKHGRKIQYSLALAVVLRRETLRLQEEVARLKRENERPTELQASEI